MGLLSLFKLRTASAKKGGTDRMKDEYYDIFKKDDGEEDEYVEELLEEEEPDSEEEDYDELEIEEVLEEEELDEEEEEVDEEEEEEIPFIEEEEEEEVDEEEEEAEEFPSELTSFYLANKYYYEGDYANAISMYNAAIKEESDESVVAKSLYWTGESYVKLNRMDDAINVFTHLIEQFDDHYLGASAERRIASLQEIYDN